MFHSDISFTAKEKAVQFGEDAKIFMISYKDAIDFVKEKASNDQSKEHYLENAKNLVNSFRWNYLTFTKLTNPKRSLESPLTPTFNNDDERFKMAKYAHYIFSEQFDNIKHLNTFEKLSKKLDHVYEHLEKQTKL